MTKHLKTAGTKVSIQFKGKRPELKIALTKKIAHQLYIHLRSRFES